MDVSRFEHGQKVAKTITILSINESCMDKMRVFFLESSSKQALLTDNIFALQICRRHE